jgi:rhodanese-related sulfurtransferase
MPKTVKDMMAEANAAVTRVGLVEAQAMIADGALVLDVRDAPELAAGKIKGALHVPRGMLEFRADPATQYHNPELQMDRPVLVYCASGGRSALSGKLLQEMGFAKVFSIGGFKDWVEAGGEVEGGVIFVRTGACGVVYRGIARRETQRHESARQLTKGHFGR